MVTAAAPDAAKVWAAPFLDKPDIFNCYPHWPVTRGMRTSWLDDLRAFERPSHSNLVNLVSPPIAETRTRKDFLWLIGICTSEGQALAAARAWLSPGSIRPVRGLGQWEFSRRERAYSLTLEPGADVCEFDLVPADDGPCLNPAFLLQGWQGDARVDVSAGGPPLTGPESGLLAVYVPGRLTDATRIRVQRRP
jgi:hypothetical protein